MIVTEYMSSKYSEDERCSGNQFVHDMRTRRVDPE